MEEIIELFTIYTVINPTLTLHQPYTNSYLIFTKS